METHGKTGQIALRDILATLFRRKIIIIITMVATMLYVYVAHQLKTPVYQASVSLIVYLPKETGEASFAYPFLTLPNFLVSSNKVVEPVVKTFKLYNIPLDYEKNFSSRLQGFLIEKRVKELERKLAKLTPEQRQAMLYQMAIGNLKGKIGIIVGGDDYIDRDKTMPVGFGITVSDFSPELAVALANAVSISFLIVDYEFKIADLVVRYGEKNFFVVEFKKYIAELQEYRAGKPIPELGSIVPSQYKILEPAKITGYTGVDIRNKLPIAFLGGIFLGSLLVFFLEAFQQAFRSPKSIESFLDMPCLGSLPRRKSKKRLLVQHNPNSAGIDGRFYQNLSDQLDLLIKDKNLKAILITDAEGSEDTSVVSGNICVYLSHMDLKRKILLIDANLRKPSIHKVFNYSDTPGLGEVLEGKATFHDVIKNVDSNLTILPAGKTGFNPAIILDSSIMSDIIQIAKEQYDTIFLACSDIRHYTDALILSARVEGVVVVINEGKVRRQIVKQAIAPLQEKDVYLIGAILNNRTFPIPKIIYKWV